MAEEINKKDEITDDTTETVEETVNTDNTEGQEEAPPEKTELDLAQEQISGLSDKLMRTAAEFDNYKKRTAREKEDFYKTAVCDTVLALLPVLDNLDRAIAAAEGSDNDGSVLDGVKMIKKQFDDALNSIGVSAIDAIDCEFDPEKHNAVMTEESDKPENTVIDELQKGYMYKDKVVRHSMVKVSN